MNKQVTTHDNDTKRLFVGFSPPGQPPLFTSWGYEHGINKGHKKEKSPTVVHFDLHNVHDQNPKQGRHLTSNAKVLAPTSRSASPIGVKNLSITPTTLLVQEGC